MRDGNRYLFLTLSRLYPLSYGVLSLKGVKEKSSHPVTSYMENALSWPSWRTQDLAKSKGASGAGLDIY